MKKLLAILTLCLPLVFTACIKDDEPDFSVPTLTDNNTIQFTIKIDDRLTFHFDALWGEKTAIDWGDGKVEKMYATNTDTKGHKFKSAGTYRIKIWSDHLTLFNVSGLFHPMNDISIGNCPKLETLGLGGFVKTTSFKINGSCPNLTDLNIGNWADLESVDLSNCPNIKTLSCYTHPKLKKLDVSKNEKLESLHCFYNGLTELVIGDNISTMRSLNCSYNNLTTLNLGNLTVSELAVDNNKLTSLDLSKMTTLSQLYCDSNDIKTLKITANKLLKHLSCTNNLLASLDVSENKQLVNLRIAKNKMNAQALNNIFTALPDSPTLNSTKPGATPNKIMFYENEGENGCNADIITNKGWIIAGKE